LHKSRPTQLRPFAFEQIQMLVDILQLPELVSNSFGLAPGTLRDISFPFGERRSLHPNAMRIVSPSFVNQAKGRPFRRRLTAICQHRWLCWTMSQVAIIIRPQHTYESVAFSGFTCRTSSVDPVPKRSAYVGDELELLW
jgi:hypothetical protein